MVTFSVQLAAVFTTGTLPSKSPKLINKPAILFESCKFLKRFSGIPEFRAQKIVTVLPNCAYCVRNCFRNNGVSPLPTQTPDNVQPRARGYFGSGVFPVGGVHGQPGLSGVIISSAVPGISAVFSAVAVAFHSAGVDLTQN